MDSEDNGCDGGATEAMFWWLHSPVPPRHSFHPWTDFVSSCRHPRHRAPGGDRKDENKRSLEVWLGLEIWQISTVWANKDVKVFLEKEVWVSQVQKLKSNLSPEAVMDPETAVPPRQEVFPGLLSL